MFKFLTGLLLGAAGASMLMHAAVADEFPVDQSITIPAAQLVPPGGQPGDVLTVLTDGTRVWAVPSGGGTGTDGCSIIRTANDPQAADGKDCDQAVSSSGFLWGPKTAGQWPGSPIDLHGQPGSAGPPNTLTIGTVATLPAGSAATAAITGEAPNQVLDLGVPKGDGGAPGQQVFAQIGGPGCPAANEGSDGMVSFSSTDGAVCQKTGGAWAPIGTFLCKPTMSASTTIVAGQPSDVAVTGDCSALNFAFQLPF